MRRIADLLGTDAPATSEPRPRHGQTSGLRKWLGELEVSEFISTYLQKQPVATAGRALDAIDACDWNELGRVLEAELSDVLVVARGELLSRRPPRSLPELHELFRAGAGVAVRAPRPRSASLLEVTGAVAREVPGEQRLILFATPEQTHGFGWHYDAEDVFIIQTAGDKEYWFRRNTVVPRPDRYAQPDFELVRLERSPLMSCRLLPGDFLYLPRGFWHVAYAREPSLSISIGVFPECAVP